MSKPRVGEDVVSKSFRMPQEQVDKLERIAFAIRSRGNISEAFRFLVDMAPDPDKNPAYYETAIEEYL